MTIQHVSHVCWAMFALSSTKFPSVSDEDCDNGIEQDALVRTCVL
jgi:hypothetical protein